jgi:hypothetical protein
MNLAASVSFGLAFQRLAVLTAYCHLPTAYCLLPYGSVTNCARKFLAEAVSVL